MRMTSFLWHSPKMICVLIQFNHCFLKGFRGKWCERVTVLTTWMNILLFGNCFHVSQNSIKFSRIEQLSLKFETLFHG